MEAGVRELRDKLSWYIHQVESGKSVTVTAHGRVVAELGPPNSSRQGRSSRLERLIAAGVITPPVEGGDPLEGCPKIRLAAGTAATLINSERDED